jgi:hypothetical protein
MYEEDTDVSLELADENHLDTEQAADDAARLLIEVREQCAWSSEAENPDDMD